VRDGGPVRGAAPGRAERSWGPWGGLNVMEDGSHLVRVRAQVMMREDSTGGWVPLGGGGLSHVAVRKRKVHHEDDPPCKHEYLIYGKRINDQKVVMSCTIKKDFQYNRVMPTFHHWKTGNLKYGLTFQTAADARAFDKGVKLAVEDIHAEHTVACPHLHCRVTTSPPNPGMSSPSPVAQLNRDVEDDDVFMQLELPLERDSSSGGSSPPGPTSPPAGQPASSPPPRPGFDTHQRMNFPNLHRSRTITGAPSKLPARRPPGLPPSDTGPLGDNIYEWLQSSNRSRLEEEPVKPGDPGSFHKDFVNIRYNIPLPGSEARYVPLPGEDAVFGDVYGGSDAYVKFDILSTAEPQYHYLNLETSSRGSIYKSCPSSSAGLKEETTAPRSDLRLPSPTPSKLHGKEKLGKKGTKVNRKEEKRKGGHSRALQERCVHCHELYSEAENGAGSCRYSPDVLRQGIECMSCLACAKCLLYHCHYEDENFTDDDICTCDPSDGHLGKRWLGLSLLAVLVPCLCLYPLLTACHRLGRACQLCGGRHVAA